VDRAKVSKARHPDKSGSYKMTDVIQINGEYGAQGIDYIQHPVYQSINCPYNIFGFRHERRYGYSRDFRAYPASERPDICDTRGGHGVFSTLVHLESI
jgi:hypothetical protein